MMQTKLFKTAFAILFALGFLVIVGDKLYLVDSLWWYDIILHNLGGALISLTVLLFWNYFWPASLPSRGKTIFLVTLIALVIGIIWEKYELLAGITFLSDGMAYVLDTAKDLTDDVLGSFLGAIYGLYLLKKQ